eukprot:TRINITY_DN51802_c0_g1_i1.p1 TRINITY_DN51802_c0_g1~~TRINITY_DN51802_c0_g1_i1.p1  ORF type:complete len:322 (-),score=46.35 TRINITY_DN51802_c0_g1_i1:100-1065(-)
MAERSPEKTVRDIDTLLTNFTARSRSNTPTTARSHSESPAPADNSAPDTAHSQSASPVPDTAESLGPDTDCSQSKSPAPDTFEGEASHADRTQSENSAPDTDRSQSKGPAPDTSEREASHAARSQSKSPAPDTARTAQPEAESQYDFEKDARIARLRARIVECRGNVKPRYMEELTVSASDHETRLLFPSPATTIARMRAGLPTRPPVVHRTFKEVSRQPAQETVVVVQQPAVVPTYIPRAPAPLPRFDAMERLEGVVSGIMNNPPRVSIPPPQHYYGYGAPPVNPYYNAAPVAPGYGVYGAGYAPGYGAVSSASRLYGSY